MTYTLCAAPICRLEHHYTFPSPTNMMPFIVRETFQLCRLPEYLNPHWKLIKLCIGHNSTINQRIIIYGSTPLILGRFTN